MRIPRTKFNVCHVMNLYKNNTDPNYMFRKYADELFVNKQFPSFWLTKFNMLIRKANTYIYYWVSK